MYMGTNVLACFGSPEDSDDRHFWFTGDLRRGHITAELRVKSSWERLIMVNTVQSHPEQIHPENLATRLSSYKSILELGSVVLNVLVWRDAFVLIN